MSEIIIEKGVPMPHANANSCRYPWGLMEVGDSFFVAGKSSAGFGNVNRTKGRKFTARTVTENGSKGVRIWRIE